MCEALPQAHEFASAHVDIAFLLRNLRLHVEKRNADWRYFRPHLEHAAPGGGKSWQILKFFNLFFCSFYWVFIHVYHCLSAKSISLYVLVCIWTATTLVQHSSTIVFHSISMRVTNLAAYFLGSLNLSAAGEQSFCKVWIRSCALFRSASKTSSFFCKASCMSSICWPRQGVNRHKNAMNCDERT